MRHPQPSSLASGWGGGGRVPPAQAVDAASRGPRTRLGTGQCGFLLLEVTTEMHPRSHSRVWGEDLGKGSF